MAVTTSPHTDRMHVVSRSLRVISTINTLMEHVIHKPIESRRAYQHRRHTLGLAIIMALVVAAALVVLLIG